MSISGPLNYVSDFRQVYFPVAFMIHFIPCQILFVMSSSSPDVYITAFCTSMSSLQWQNGVLLMKSIPENITDVPVFSPALMCPGLQPEQCFL